MFIAEAKFSHRIRHVKAYSPRQQTRSHLVSLSLLLVLVLEPLIARAANEPAWREWTVDGVVREALVYVPAKAKTDATSVVFAFHGHGGSMNNAARMFGY